LEPGYLDNEDSMM